MTPRAATPLERCRIRRFTAYRRNISERETHNALQKNADNEPQFEGVVWTDGTVTLRWLTACKSTSVWANLADCLAVHGHPEYGTEIIWHDDTRAPSSPLVGELREALERYGQHIEGCPRKTWHVKALPFSHCTCGLDNFIDSALARAKERG